MLQGFRCFFGNHAEPVRQEIGGWRCPDCGKPGASLADLGWGDGYVRLERETYDRDKWQGKVTRAQWVKALL